MSNCIEYKHMVRLGTNAEKKYCREYKDTYDAIVINANILAHTTNSMSSFLGCELSRPFLIDPQTYAFQYYSGLLQTSKKDDETFIPDIKRSIKTLLSKYGEKITNIISTQKRAVTPQDFLNDGGHSFMKELCGNVINFQQNTVKNESSENSEYSEYIEYDVKSNCSNLQLKPFAIIAPYFYMTENTLDDWININIEAINICKSTCVDPIFAQIVIDKDILLNEAQRNILIAKYASSNCDGFFIWIDNFDEKNSSSSYLNGFINLLQELKQSTNKPIYQIYGSYLSIILTKDYLTGTCHGMEYGETREVFPVGGGVPVSKFYFPIIHNRLLFRNVLDVLITKDWLKDKQTYFEKVCNCKTCNEVIQNNPNTDFGIYGNVKSTTFNRKKGDKEYSVTMDYPTIDSKDVCLRHYLNNKKIEFDNVQAYSIEALCQQLEDSYHELYYILGDSIGYLLTWNKILKNFYSIPE